VVCVIGNRSGAGFPQPAEAEPYARLLPPDMPRASYTQWEFLLARKHRRNTRGVLFDAKALFARSEPLIRRALAIGEASLGNDHPDVATCLNNLASLLQATNRLGEA
jgi:hypothetical protein